MKPAELSCALVACVAAPAALADVTLSLYTLPEGNTIIQVTDAVVSNTGGGPSTDETRTAYYFEPDFGDPQPNLADYTGGVWPYIYVSKDAVLGDLIIDDGITAEISLLTNPASAAELQWVLIDGNPIYQFINDTSELDANGNFGPWFYIEADGTATQSRVPAPGAAGLLAVAGLAVSRRQR